MSSEYPGANYDAKDMKRIASELRAESLSAAIAGELNQQGFTGRRGGPLYMANIARLVGPKSAADTSCVRPSRGSACGCGATAASS